MCFCFFLLVRLILKEVVVVLIGNFFLKLLVVFVVIGVILIGVSMMGKKESV